MNTEESKLQRFLREAKQTLRVSLPLVAAQLVQMSMGFVDTIMAGNLSARALAAVAVAGSLIAPLLVFVIGMLLATNPIVAQLYGGRKHAEVGKNFWQSLWLSQCLAVPAFFVLREMHTIMHLMNVRPEIIPITQGYLNAYSWGLPAVFAYLSMRFFNEGITHTKPSLYFALLGLTVNVIGNYTFMYGNFGFPAMGAVGTGLATAVVFWVMLAGMSIYVYAHRRYAEFMIREGLSKPQWSYIRELLRVGVPNGFNVTIEVSMFAVAALIIGSFGVDVVAGHQIAINFASLTFMIPLGLSIGTTARVGFAVGEKKLPLARYVGHVGVALGAFVMTLTAILMFTAPELIASIYTSDKGVSDVAVKLLLLAAAFQISDGVQVCVIGALRGLKDTKVPMLFSLVAYWILGFPTGYVLGVIYGMGAEGLWIGMIVGLSVAAVLHNIRFNRLTAGNGRHSQPANMPATIS